MEDVIGDGENCIMRGLKYSQGVQMMSDASEHKWEEWEMFAKFISENKEGGDN